MNSAHIFTVYAKELRDLLRDRRTLLSMIVIPTLVMPVLFFAIGYIGFKVVKQARAEQPAVMLLGAEHDPALAAELAAYDEIRLVEPTTDWRARIANKRLRAVVEIPADFAATLARDKSAALKLYHYEGELKSGLALRRLRTFLTDRRTTLVEERLAARDLPATLLRPYDILSENVAPPETVGGNAIGGLLPYLFIILCFTGAMYPAIDLTAGEKERGTMETILCSPIGRLDLVFGKFLMVLTASLATVVFTLLSMGLTLLVAGNFLGAAFGADAAAAASSSGGSSGVIALLNPLGLVGMVAMIIPFAVLISAAQLAICLFAKSYKEAQSYVSPLIIVIIMPAVVGMLPGVELDLGLALLPVLNLSLVSKEMVSGVFNWHYIGLIFGSSCIYAAAALWWCVRMFNREDVIFRT